MIPDTAAPDLSDTPNIVPEAFRVIDAAALDASLPTHPPRILLLYGSLRPRSFSRLLTFEAERILKAFGAETRVFDPAGLPLPARARPTTRRSRSCATFSSGRRAKSGPARNATAR